MKFFLLPLAVFLLLGSAGVSSAKAQSAAEYDRQMRVAMQKLTREIKATTNGKYLVRFETSDATTPLYFVPNKVLWRKLSNAGRIKIADDWWHRWRKISKPDEAMNELQSLDGRKDVYCSLSENGIDPVCGN